MTTYPRLTESSASTPRRNRVLVPPNEANRGPLAARNERADPSLGMPYALMANMNYNQTNPRPPGPATAEVATPGLVTPTVINPRRTHPCFTQALLDPPNIYNPQHVYTTPSGHVYPRMDLRQVPAYSAPGPGRQTYERAIPHFPHPRAMIRNSLEVCQNLDIKFAATGRNP